MRELGVGPDRPGPAARPLPPRRTPRPAPPVVLRAPDKGRQAHAGRAVLVQLQALAGNTAVADLLGASRRSVQRLVGTIPPPPVAPAPADPQQHPGFRAAAGRLAGARRKARSHPSPRGQADAAARAAKPPSDHKESQAKAAKAAEMGAAPVGGFDKAGFIAAVSAAIAKAAPKNLEEADKFADSDRSAAVAAEVKGKVGAGKDASAKPMADASAKAPDESKAVDKPVTPLPPAPAAGAPPVLGAQEAMPTRAPAEQTELGNGPAETDAKMGEAGVTEDQLAHSNEPELTGALAAKKEGEQHSATAPAAFRAQEAQQLAAAQQGAQAAGLQGAAGMVAVRGTALQQAAGAQRRTQGANESDRATVTSKVRSIFDATKTAVDAILNGIDPQVDAAFTAGEAKAKAAFTAHHKARMDAYKDERYSGLLGAGRWIRDKFADLPGEVNAFYVEAKQIYENQMRVVISDVADLVGRELSRAKTRIAEGRTEITTYVKGLDPKLRSIGRQAADEIGSQFESLEASVDEKSQSLAEDLAEKYVAARNAVDEEIKALQEENKGLWSKAKDAIGGAIETILKLKDMLLGVLARAAGAVEKIIKDPIGFLGNFVNAVKTGVMNFGANILDHLKKGLQSWLFGALAEAGIELPEKFDLKGIVTLILSLLGLTWQSIRARLAKVLPEWVLKALETAVDVVKILATEGVGGLWKWIVEKITDLKDQVMGQIKDFVITKIITAGITWLISLLNPAAAFIKACKMIYDAVMWFVDNAERLKDFVNSVLDSVESIASGGVGAVASMIESTLAKAVPMVISGLASLLGLGGIADKIKSILQSIQKPVGKVVDGLIAGAMKVGKKLLKRKGKKKDADEPSGAAEAKDQLLLKLAHKQPFTMKGHAHHLYVTRVGGKPALLMASNPGLVLQKINVALNNPEVKKEPEIVGRLTSARSAITTFQTDLDLAFAQSDSKAIRAAESGLLGEINTINSTLLMIGQLLDIDDLKVSDFVDSKGNVRDGLDIRVTFYGPARYQKHLGAKLTEAHDLKQAKRAELMSKFPVAFAKSTFYCPGVPRLNIYPHLADDTAVTLDHKQPVAQHWNDDGRKTTQAKREEFYALVSNLQAMCGSCNSAKKSEGVDYIRKTEAGFEPPPKK